MATNYPAGLDDFANYVDGVTVMESAVLNDMQLAIEALQAKVGIDSSAVAASHDYKLAYPIERGWLPNIMAGGNDSDGTVTFPNGLIWKWGKEPGGLQTVTVTFAAAFPNACFQAFAQEGNTGNRYGNVSTHTLIAASFKIYSYGGAQVTTYRWFAVGR